jgi:hypothetical protein
MLTNGRSDSRVLSRDEQGTKMLAAIPAEETRVLQLFELALRLVGSGSQKVPDQLKTYFDTVLEQARRLANDPTAVSGTILPEAIQLAIDLRDVEELRNAVDNLSSLAAITPERANAILVSLERHVAS